VLAGTTNFDETLQHTADANELHAVLPRNKLASAAGNQAKTIALQNQCPLVAFSEHSHKTCTRLSSQGCSCASHQADCLHQCTWVVLQLCNCPHKVCQAGRQLRVIGRLLRLLPSMDASSKHASSSFQQLLQQWLLRVVQLRQCPHHAGNVSAAQLLVLQVMPSSLVKLLHETLGSSKSPLAQHLKAAGQLCGCQGHQTAVQEYPGHPATTAGEVGPTKARGQPNPRHKK